MLSTPRRNIAYPNPDRSDRPDVPAHLQNLANALDVDVIYVQGTEATRLARGHQPGGGLFFWCTDTGLMWYDDGAAWQQVSAGNGLVPVGGVCDYPWASSIPAYMVLPYGQAISRTTYAALAAIAAADGYTYGAGDGVNTFNIPDYRGRVGAGRDNMGGAASNRLTVAISGLAGATLGAVGGSEGVTLTTAQIPAHNHIISDPGHAHFPDIDTAGGNPWAGGGGTGALGGHNVTPATGGHLGTTGITEGLTGGGGAHPNVQPTIVVNKLMRIL